ncbi:hypothetical protein LTR12_005099 [Friedmanniomyces endolithicus]|nr:hypothetical protein LTR74_001734 [Friedmanniomyces endolithicus]KAK1820511.1 hypothetical protein LTR12_005099 [Friedmanniomyces endolithicus]
MANSTAYQRATVEDADETPQLQTSTNGNGGGNGGGNGNNNTTVGADDPEPGAQPEPITIIFADVNGFELSFRLKQHTKLGKAMEAFAKRTERDPGTLRFLFEGERLLPESTTESMGMEDGDRVEVHHEQIGGGGGAELPPPESITLTFADGQGYELFFKIKRSTELGRAIDAFAKRTDRELETLRFSFNGEPVLPHATVDSMGMADHDRVEVQYEQVEGGADWTQTKGEHHEQTESGAVERQPETLSSLTFSAANDCELTFKIQRNAELGKAMETFAVWAGTPRYHLRFLFFGSRWSDDTTMISEDMEDGDRVTVFHEQAGGSANAEVVESGLRLSALQL